jgi:hypothetical protein
MSRQKVVVFLRDRKLGVGQNDAADGEGRRYVSEKLVGEGGFELQTGAPGDRHPAIRPVT